jgi:TRAP-type C4-dicarboxylate transport system substrate-binding protein
MLMSQLTRLGLSGAIAAIATAATIGVGNAEIPETKIAVIAGDTYNPMFRRVIAPFWTERVAKASGGKVQVQATAWNEMGLKGPEVFRLVRKGTYKFGASVLAYTSGDVKINDGFDLGLMSPTLGDVQDVIRVFRPYFERHYEKELGLKVLAIWPLPPQVLYCRDELKELSDLKGRKVRVSGRSQADVVRHFGGTDVNIAFGEMQTALQTGVVDCGLTSTTSGYSTGWQEVTSYLYPIPINWQLYSFLVNLDHWNSLNPELQDFLQGQINWLEARLTEEAQRELDIGVNCLTGNGPCPEGQAGDMTLVTVTEQDKKNRMEALEKTVVPTWSKACGADCVRMWNNSVGAHLGITAPAP